MPERSILVNKSGQEILANAITRSGRLKVSQKFPQFESKHVSGANDTLWERRVWGAIINHGAVTGAGFQVGELFEEQTAAGVPTGKRGRITAKTASSITYDTTHSSMVAGGSNNNFTDGATHKIVGLTTASFATTTNHDTGSHHYFDYDTSSVRLKVGTASGDRSLSHSIRRIPYFSGFEPDSELTWLMAEPKTNLDQYILVGDRQNGIGLWVNGLDIYFVIIKNGSILPENKVSINMWVEKPKNITSTAQILEIIYKWLGYDYVGAKMITDGNIVTIAEKTFADKVQDVFLQNPSAFIYFEIVNTGVTASASEFRIVCSNISSEGGVTLPGIEFSAPPISAAVERAVAASAVTPILLVRLKNNFPSGKPNRKTVRYLDFKASSRTDNAFVELAHVHGAISITVGGVPTPINSASWASPHAGSAVEYLQGVLTNLVAEEIHPVAEDFLISGVGQNGSTSVNTAEFISNHSFLSQNYESLNSQMLCIYVKVPAGTANVWAHISWLELE